MRPTSAKVQQSFKGSRDSQEHIEYHDQQQYEESKQDEEERTVKYSDPAPMHPSKKYDGYVDKAINRMESDGVLPTPSVSNSQSKRYSFGYNENDIGLERQSSADEQYKYAVTKLSQLNVEDEDDD